MFEISYIFYPLNKVKEARTNFVESSSLQSLEELPKDFRYYFLCK